MSGPLVVTGANGFVGAHVAEIAASRGVEVWGIAREREANPRLAPHVTRYFAADLQHEWPVDAAPSAVVHLAGLAAVGPSFTAPQRYLNVNSAIMTTMSEALLARGGDTRVVVVSSGTVYATPVDTTPIAETAPTIPTSPYAVAKILVETQAAYYARRGLDTVVARPFNHIGPGQGTGFLIPDLATALRTLAPGAPLTVGNLDAARDYTDVRDVANAYLTLAFAADHDHRVYNVASGSSHTGRDVLETIAEALGRDVPDTVVDAARLRPNDPPHIAGDASRLRDEFAWAPRIGWRESVADFLTATAH